MDRVVIEHWATVHAIVNTHLNDFDEFAQIATLRSQ